MPVFTFLPHFLHIWPTSEKLSTTVFHVFSIYGQYIYLEIVQHWLSLVFFYSLSICGKYLEMVQKLITSMFSEYHKVRKLENMGLTWPCNSHMIPIGSPSFFPDNFQLWSIYGPYYWFGKGKCSISLIQRFNFVEHPAVWLSSSN